MTPRYEEISINEVIARAKMSLRLTNTNEHDSFLEILATEALDSLNAISQLVKKQCQITFTNNMAELPKSFIKLLALKIDSTNIADTNDPIANQLLNNISLAMYVDTKFLNSCGFNENFYGINNLSPYNRGFQINNGFIHFNFSEDTGQILTATLAYMGLNTDEDGNTLIYRRYERAVVAYLCYKFSLTWVESSNQYVIEKYNQEWVAQRSKMIGQDVANDYQNNKYEINKFFNSLLVSRTVNIT